MLGTLEQDQKQDWKSHVTSLVHAYNCTRQDSTGQSPYFIMFGREPRLPVDLVFDLQTCRDDQSMTQYAEALKERLRTAYKIATANTSKAQQRQKNNYDRNVRSSRVLEGDLVLVKIVAFDGKHKLSDKWEEEPYRILAQPNRDIPVYVVQKDSGEGRRRTLHRNLLLPIDTPMKRPEPPEITRPTPAPRKPRNVQRNIGKPDPAVRCVDYSSSESEDEEVVIEVIIPDKNVTQDVHQDQENDVTTEEPDSEPEVIVGDALHVEADEAAVQDRDAEDERRMPPPQLPPQPLSPQLPRRSRRERRPPQWFQSGDYVMSQQTAPDWIQRAEYLRTLATSGILQDCEENVKDTFLKIVSSNT